MHDEKVSEPRTIDRMLRAIAHRATVGGPTPPMRLLAPIRSAAIASVLPAHRARAEQCAARLAAGDASARADLADLAEQALQAMRTEVRTRAIAAGALSDLAASADARWGDCDTEELLDRPSFDEEKRRGIMSDLDRVNGLLGNYDRFLDALLPLAAIGRTTRVLDLAAGHGGFALAAARAARSRGLDFHFTASDLKREYLDMGEAEARREKLSVEFRVQDALDLSNLAPDSYDIIVCTQSLHHFPAGLVALMFEAAARAASTGVVFIDGCRSALSGVSVVTLGALLYRNAFFAHDGWISTRRFFVPEELELLARIGSWGDHVESSWMAPGYCLLRLPTMRGLASCAQISR